MSLAIKQTVFFLLLSFYLLLLLLLGESYFGYILLGLGSIFLLSFSSHLDWQQLSKYPTILLLWLFFILGLILSAIFTSSLPLSIFALSKILFSILVFWFFLLVKKSLISLRQVIELILLISLVISVMSILIQFLPDLAQFLPGMNILYATYGHNHIAALLILILPISWWIANKNSRKERNWWWLLPTWFSLVLLLSFGRVAILIGFIQFLIISKYLKSNKAVDINKNRILKIITLIFFIVLAIKVFFSVSFWLNPNFNCPVSPRWEKQICKSFEVESRPHYWYWAAKIFQNNFLLGSGPGTFGIAAKKFHLDIFISSAYAHNAFLKAFAEMGLIGGGAFLLLMLGLLIKSWVNNNLSSKLALSTALLLGTGAIYFNALFDFDWSFIGIFSLTLIYLALLIKKSGKSKKMNHCFLNFFKLIYFLSAGLLIILSSFYLATEGLIRSNKISKAFDLFPYFHWHRKIFEAEFNFENSQQNKLLRIYEFHPEIYSAFYSKETDLERKQFLLEKWVKVDPWQLVNQNIVDYYIQIKDWSTAEERSILVRNFWQWVERNDDYHVSRLDKMKLDDQMLVIAEAYYQQGLVAASDYSENSSFKQVFDWLKIISEGEFNWEKEQRLAEILVKVGNKFSKIDIEKTIITYNLAKKHVPWILSTEDLWFEQQDAQELEVAEMIKYLQLTANWQGETMGWKDVAQRLLQQQTTERFLVAGDLDNLAQVLAIVDWSQHDYDWRLEFVRNLTKQTDTLAKRKDYQLALDLLSSAQNLLPGDYWLMVQPANLEVLRGDLESAKQFYQKCLDTYPGSHHDNCYYGIELIEKNYFNPDHYFQVSKIIRGEAVWQDFVK